MVKKQVGPWIAMVMGIVLVALVILVVLSLRPQPVKTIPIQPPTVELIPQPTPRMQEDRGVPTPRAPDIEPTSPGIKAEKVFPDEVTFWVNEILVPETSMYEGASFIPIKKSQLKTFAGSFGPYDEDPSGALRVVLCAEFTKVQAAPSCETVRLIYRDGYASFARGYQFDEYIGGMAAKDYTAYYNVYAGDTLVAASNKAVIRTVSD